MLLLYWAEVAAVEALARLVESLEGRGVASGSGPTDWPLVPRLSSEEVLV
jgi:hypothetical protein